MTQVGSLSIDQVRTRRDLHDFIELPWRIYAVHPNWVPPLRSYVRELLDTGSHPFWKHARQKLFLARRRGRAVGRIAFILDHNYNERHDEKSAGFLARGFEHAPVVMYAYTPPYYPRLAENAGYEKEMDLFAWRRHVPEDFPPVRSRAMERMRARWDIRVRSGAWHRFDDDMRLVRRIYDEAWAENWGFVPATDEEAAWSARQYRRFADLDLLCFAYLDGQPVGLAMAVPDVNPLLMELNGSVGLRGGLYFLWHRRRWQGARVILAGIIPRARNTGVPLFLQIYLARRLCEKGYEYVEEGWVLETNRDANVMQERTGSHHVKTYRLVRKDI